MFRTARCVRAAWCALALTLAGCGGDVATTSNSSSTVAAVGTQSSSASTAANKGASGSSASSTSGSSSSGANATDGTSPAAKLAAAIGKPSRLLVGLGTQGTAGVSSAVISQRLAPDIYDRYLGGSWTTWDSPPCDYVCLVAKEAESFGAVPMFTLYQMADDGGDNLSVLTNTAFMSSYWARVKLLYQDIAAFKKPTLVNLEPDFWGFAERASPNGDPKQLAALVRSNPDCATLTDDVAGVAGCLIAMARKYAPNAYVGFPPSSWGGKTHSDVIAFMNELGAASADFIVEQTLDRDAGCYESGASYCQGSGSYYWDESNFEDFLASVKQDTAGIGNLPLIIWQTPLGVPSSTPGGSPYHYRDNREQIFLTHPTELTAVGALALVFGTGEDHQTNITTDGGQFQKLDAAYLSAPAALP